MTTRINFIILCMLLSLLLIILSTTSFAASNHDCSELINSLRAEPEWVVTECLHKTLPVAPDLSEGKSSPGDTAFALDIGYVSDNFISFPLPDMSAGTIIGQNTMSIYGLDFNTEATVLYAVADSDPNPVFGTIDLATGAFSHIADITGIPDLMSPTGFAIDPTDETFYIIDSIYLYTLNPSTGVATQIGQLTDGLGGRFMFIAIAINSQGQMYGHCIATDSIYSVNKSTGTVTLIGATGFNANYAQGMDFDPSDDTLYAWIYTGGGDNYFCSINTSTGAATEHTSISGEFEGAIQVSATQPPAAIPVFNTSGFIFLAFLLVSISIFIIRRKTC